MKFEPEEQLIVDLLSKLKNQGGTYPKKLLASRREVFLSQVASVGLGLGIGAGLKTVAKSPKSGGSFHLSSLSTSSLIEMVLVVAIVAQASVIAYSYRDRIADLIKSFSTLITPTAVVFPVTESSSQPDVVVSDTPTIITTATPTASPSSTATTGSSLSGSNNGSNNSNGATTNPEVTSTPPANGNNGNHYGQTPKPTQQKSDPKPTKDTGNGKKP